MKMAKDPRKEPVPPEESLLPAMMEWLLRVKATPGFRSPHLWIIAGLFSVLGYIYYNLVPSLHDVYVILFFYPLIYAAVAYRLHGAIISGIIFLAIVLPHAIFFSNTPSSLVRLVLFALFGLLISSLGATLLNYLEQQLSAYHEISSLNEELNSYIERLKSTQKQLIQAGKLDALGQLSASVAHEINNPLAGALVYIKLISKRIGNDSLDKEEALVTLSKVETAISRCATIVHGLLDFARQSEPVLKPINVGNVIDQAMSLVSHQAEMKKIKVTREDEPSLPPAIVDFNQLQQVIINLVVNAIQAMENGGELTLRTSRSKDNYVQVSVQDTGCGILPENMDKIFTPFFTTKEAGKGVGLGLAISYGIIERHGGRIEVQSKVGKGSTFTVYLPAQV